MICTRFDVAKLLKFMILTSSKMKISEIDGTYKLVQSGVTSGRTCSLQQGKEASCLCASVSVWGGGPPAGVEGNQSP